MFKIKLPQIRKPKYRVVRDQFAGYELQILRWYFPFWREVGDFKNQVNTFANIEGAIEFARQHSGDKNVAVEVVRDED